MEEQEEIYRRFRESKREEVRLEAALAGFFWLSGAGMQISGETGLQGADWIHGYPGRAGRGEAGQQGADADSAEERHQREYAAYLKRRIRPAMELLIRKEDTEKMEFLAAKGWFGRQELDGFLRTAAAQKKQASLLWLLHWKDKNYGYEDDEFTL